MKNALCWACACSAPVCEASRWWLLPGLPVALKSGTSRGEEGRNSDIHQGRRSETCDREKVIMHAIPSSAARAALVSLMALGAFGVVLLGTVSHVQTGAAANTNAAPSDPLPAKPAEATEDESIRHGLMDFKKENKMTTIGKVLVLVSSGHGLPLKDGKVYAGAGYYLNELTVPVRALMKAGYEITFANHKGNTPQMDVNSAVPDFFGGDEAKLQDYLKFRDSLTGLKNPTRISDVIASGLDQYDAVFVPGGHGPMMDLLDDPDAGTVMRHFHETSKPTAVLCHGPISLLSALPNSKEVVTALAAGDAARARAKAQGWIYSGYKMTIFSTAEEQQREPLEIGGKVLFYPDFALTTAGGDVSVLAPWKSYVLQDRELISGQNPFSDEALLNLLLPALNRKNSASGLQKAG